MLAKKEKERFKVHTRRIIALALCFVVVVGVFYARIFDFQVVNGSKYAEQLLRSSTSTSTIYAARGEIYDRNGIPLTKNLHTYNVELDYSFLEIDNLNEMLYKLIQIFEERKLEWIDELPISLTSPYEYTDDEDAVARLKKKLDVNSYATAENCIEWIYRNSGIKKYENKRGKCTHCKKKFEECTYEGYDEITSRKIAGIRYSMLLKDFSKYNSRYLFAEDIPQELVIYLEEMSSVFPGLSITQATKRSYVNKDVASHLIGLTGKISPETADYYKELNRTQNANYLMTDTVGLSGVEYAMESTLRGKNGTQTVTKDTKGNIISVEETTAPQVGNSVRLTIDYLFQQEVQGIFSSYLSRIRDGQKVKADGGSIVVLDTKTNGVLAAVSYPYYTLQDAADDYNEVEKTQKSALKNRAFVEIYRPGSTFKPITGFAALNEKKIAPSQTVFCTGKYTYWEDYQPGCLGLGGHKHSGLNIIRALRFSCNTYFYDCGRLVGYKTLNEYAKAFGLGVDTGLEVKNSVGFLSSPEQSQKYGQQWYVGNVIQAAIGQFDTKVTPLQMSLEASTIANKGVRYNAHIIDSVTSYDGAKIIEKKEAVVANTIEDKYNNFENIKDGMIAVAKDRPYYNAYDIGIKTGTPQSSGDSTDSAFIGFYPTAAPEISISCIVENGISANELGPYIVEAWERAKVRAAQIESGELVAVEGGVKPKNDAPKDETNSSENEISSIESGETAGESPEPSESPATSSAPAETASSPESTPASSEDDE